MSGRAKGGLGVVLRENDDLVGFELVEQRD